MRILAIDYLSSLVHFVGVVETVGTRAQKFAAELKTAGVGDRPVLFICHSMGEDSELFLTVIYHTWHFYVNYGDLFQGAY